MAKKTTQSLPAIVPELVTHLPLLLGLYAAVDVEAFRDAVFALLHALFGGEFVCLVFQQGAETCQQIFRDKFEFTSVEEMTYFMTSMPGVERFWTGTKRKLYRYTDLVPAAEVRESEYYQRVMKPQGWLYQGGLFLWERDRLVALTAVHRSEKDGDFTEAEMAIFEALHPHFAVSCQRLVSLHRERASRLALEELVRQFPLPTLILAWDLRVIHCNPAGRDAIRHWPSGSPGSGPRKESAPFRVPPDLLEACRGLRGRSESRGRRNGHENVEPITIPAPMSSALRATIQVTQWTKAAAAEPAFIVQFEEMKYAHGSGSALVLLQRLTPSERRIVLAVCKGATNREVAVESGKSEATVKKQLHSAYEKLQVRSRTQLAAMLHEAGNL